MHADLIGLYPVVFYGTAMCVAVAELMMPAYRQTQPVGPRWAANLGLYFTSLVVQRFCLPVSLLVVAEASARSQFGLSGLFGSGWVAVALGVVLFDLWKYFEHRLLHQASALWRLHLVHHSDLECDFTTTERHHPLEIVFSFVSSVAAVYLLGIPTLAVVIFVLLAAGVTMVSHANIRIAEAVDRWLRRVVVTPAFHNIHHSAAPAETDSNFGTVFSIWDRLFGTHRTPSAAAAAERVMGLEYFRDARATRLDQVLCQPFLRPTARPHAACDEPEARASLPS